MQFYTPPGFDTRPQYIPGNRTAFIDKIVSFIYVNATVNPYVVQVGTSGHTGYPMLPVKSGSNALNGNQP